VGDAGTAHRWLLGVLVALVALVGIVVTAEPASAGRTPSITLTPSSSTLRTGRPLVLTVEAHDAPADWLPATARFVSEGGDGFVGDVPFGDDFKAQMRIEAPRSIDYNVFVFPSQPYGAIFGSAVDIEVIDGFTVQVTSTAVPAHPQPGDDVIFRVTVADGPAASSAEGGANIPTGVVRVRSQGQTLAQRALNGGVAAIPFTMPNAPVSVAYEGDDLFIGSTSAPFSPAVPPSPTFPPPTVPPASQPATTPGGTVGATPGDTAPVTTTPVADAPEDDPVEVDPEVVGDETVVEEAAGPAPAPGGDGGDEGEDGVQRSAFVLGIPSPVSLDWGGAHLVVNLLLALLLMILTGIPSGIVDKTLEENHHRIVHSFAGEEAAIRRVETWLQALPDPVLLAGLSIVAALVFTGLNPSSAFDATTAVLFIALVVVVAIVVSIHDLARLPFLNRRYGTEAAAFGLYPFSLILAFGLVLISRLAGFEPGFVFGVIGTLAVSTAVSRRHTAVGLVAVGIALLVTALVAWFLWQQVVDEVTQPHPDAIVVFLDAFLAGLWLTAVQAVAFGYAPMSFFDGGKVREWSPRTWLALQGTGMFLLVQFYLHPSAGRWGALDSTSMRSALSVWAVFLVASILFWAWFRFRPRAEAVSAGEPESVRALR
jgi:hypothetical protein